MGGAKIEPVLGDAQSTPDGGTAEVEKMNSAGVSAIVGGYASSICLATTQTAARYDLPYLVDVGVTDAIVTRGLKNTFRFGPGFGVIAKTALDNLVAINDKAGKPAKTVMIVHEDFGVRLGPRQAAQRAASAARLPGAGDHRASDADARLQQRRAQDQGADPDIVIPANYYNEYVLLARTMQQQKVRPKAAIYSVLGGAASSYKFVKEFPEAAQYIMDCNHWFDPRSAKAQALKKKVEAKGQFFTYEVYLNYCCIGLLGRRPRTRQIGRPRQDHRGASEFDLVRPRHALRADEIRQRPEPGRGARQHAGARQRHPGDPAGGLRFGEAGLSAAKA